MGIQGLLKHLGSGKRTSLAALAAQHYAAHQRPLRLGIDIAIWLFQIQATQGGSNPALRTFYYRLLRLIPLNIDPLFVFDGPNKPTFKRNKKVGGPGVRVATVPEFLAKQLLKQFGFPMHIAPGEAEAECALLQREGIIDAVLSEDVDTMMFGSTLTLRNWTSLGSSKTPTHVDLYDASVVESASGLDSHGMILVALMSGGDYIPEGIPGCGPKQAVDAARAGFGKRLCAFSKSDKVGLAKWRAELQEEFRTNASKFFTRRNTTLVVPDTFPNFEVLGYYTNPSVSGASKLDELRRTLRWDLTLDLSALRLFAGDAFDWHYRGGAVKFIRNLAPALLVRELRLLSEQPGSHDEVEQDALERGLLEGLHGVREHASTDMSSELRVSFVPAKLVPIDMSQEVDEPETTTAVQELADDDNLDDEAEDDDGVPETPSRRRRMFRPYEEAQPERIWILRDWVQLGCPAMLEDYEAALRAPKPAPAKKAPAKRPAKRATVVDKSMQPNALMRHVRTAKTSSILQQDQQSAKVLQRSHPSEQVETVNLASSPPASQAAQFAKPSVPAKKAQPQPRFKQIAEPPKTPSRKRAQETIPTPQSGRSMITDFFSPSIARQQGGQEVISLLSSSPSRSPSQRHAAVPEQRPRKLQRADSRTLQEMTSNAALGRVERLPLLKVPRAPLQKSLTMPLIGTVAANDSGTTAECLDLAGPAELPTYSGLWADLPNPGRQAVVTAISHAVTTVAAKKSDTNMPKTSSVTTQQGTLSLTRESPRKTIRIRESAVGAWAIDDEETLDLSALRPGEPVSNAIKPPRRQGRIWRVSGVDVVDLTDA